MYKEKLNMYAHRLQGLFFIWSYKRRKMISHLKFLIKSVTVFQSTVRRRIAKRYVHDVRMKLHNKLARMIQRAFLRFIYGYRRSALQRQLLISLRWQISKMRKLITSLITNTRGASRGSVGGDSLGSQSSAESGRRSRGRGDGPAKRVVYELNIQIGRRRITSLEVDKDMGSDEPSERAVSSVLGVLRLPNGAVAVEADSMLDRFLCYLLGMGNYNSCFSFAGEMLIALQRERPFRHPYSPLAQIARRLDELPDRVAAFNWDATAGRLSAYSAIMAQWPRAGRNLIVRKDYAEEGLLIPLQAALLSTHFRMSQPALLESETETLFQATLLQIPGLGERTSTSGVFQRLLQQTDRLVFYASACHSGGGINPLLPSSAGGLRLLDRAKRLLIKAQSMMTDSSAYFDDLRLKRQLFTNLYSTRQRLVFSGAASFPFRGRLDLDRDLNLNRDQNSSSSSRGPGSLLLESSGCVEMEITVVQCGEDLFVHGTTTLRQVLASYRSNGKLLGYLSRLLEESEEVRLRALPLLMDLPMSLRPLLLDKAEVDHLALLFDLLEDQEPPGMDMDAPADPADEDLPVPLSEPERAAPPRPPSAGQRDRAAVVNWSDISDEKLVQCILDNVKLATCSDRFQDPLIGYCVRALEEMARAFIDSSLASDDYRREALLSDFGLSCPCLSLRLPAIDYRRRLDSEKGTQPQPYPNHSWLDNECVFVSQMPWSSPLGCCRRCSAAIGAGLASGDCSPSTASCGGRDCGD